MWAVLRKARSDDQPAETFSTIAAVHGWLTAQGAACNTADFHKLRAAVSVLTKTVKPRQEEVCPLCSSWNVRQYNRKQRRPLAILIKELEQLVISEGSRLRASLGGQTGAAGSSAEQRAPLAGPASSNEASASSAEQSTSSVEQSVEMFNSIADVKRWLTVQHGAINTADFS